LSKKVKKKGRTSTRTEASWVESDLADMGLEHELCRVLPEDSPFSLAWFCSILPLPYQLVIAWLVGSSYLYGRV
jgi:hypothetical protein